MKLRGRLAWIVLATTAPLVAGAVFAMNTVWDRMAVHKLGDVVRFRMENGGREECERTGRIELPASQRAEIWGYASDFHSANPQAPAFPSDLRAALDGGAEDADAFVREGQRRILLLAVRMAWREGPCAVVLAREEVRPDPRALHDLVVGSALVGLGLVVAVLLAAGPAVARIRALAAGVRRSSAERWRTPVEEHGSDEIADLARAFNGAAAEVRAHVETLERREQTLREFVANTDHDLTIPLTVLLGELAEMRRRVQAGGAVDAARVEAAAQEADYMASLVRNLGVAARLEAGEPEIARAPVDLNALVVRVVARHRPIAAAAGVALEFSVPEEVVLVDGDETLLEQAASNLVHNAVRHHRRGGHAAVTLEAPKVPGGTFVLTVRDDGPGLSDAERKRLCGGESDVEAARPRVGGRVGLGLRIVRKVAERHGLQFRLLARSEGGLVAEVRGPRRAT